MGFHHMWQRIWERRAARCLVYHTQTKLDSWEIGRHNQSSSNFYLQGNSVCDKQDQPAVGGEHTHTQTQTCTHTCIRKGTFTLANFIPFTYPNLKSTLATGKQTISSTHCQWSVVFPALLTHIHDAHTLSTHRLPLTNVQSRPLDVYSSANSKGLLI